MSQDDERLPLSPPQNPQPQLDKNLAQLVFLAGGAYSAGIFPLTLFIITQQKADLSPDALDKDSVSWSLTFFWLGWALAALTLLPWVDQFGRKWPYIILITGGLAATIVSIQAHSAACYAPAVFFIGFLLKPGGTVGYILMQESIPERTWATAVMLLNVICSCYGVLSAVVSGTVTRNISWRIEVLLYHIPFLLIVVLGPTMLTESPAFKKAERPSVSYLDLWRQEEPRKRIFATIPCWAACIVGFYGLSYSAGSISSHLYTNLALLSLADIFGYGLAGPIVNRFGAKRSQIFAFVVSACLLILCCLLPRGHVRVATAIAGRLALDLAFTTVYILLLHCFPPETRGSAAGLANFGARCAGLVTPLFSLMRFVTACMVMAALCGFAAVMTWTLPSDRASLEKSEKLEKADST